MDGVGVAAGSVSVTTSGDFCPGAMAAPCGRVASIVVTGSLARSTRTPSFTCRRLQPVSRRIVSPMLVAMDARMLTTDLRRFIREPFFSTAVR